MSVSLSEVKRAARAHRAPLAGESAGYLVLALADQVLSAPRVVSASDVQLTEDGALRIARGEASSEGEAELSLRRALDDLLLVASSGSAALMRAGRRTAPSGLSALVKELEAALIPVNRAAAKRALSRLHRETARALVSGQLPADEPERAAAVEIAAPIEAPAELEPWLPPALSSLDGVVTALCDEPELALSPVSDALTIALEVSAPRAEPVALAEVPSLDDEIEIIEEEPIDELTTAIELPAEACTRPEPVIVRKSVRPLIAQVLPLPEAPSPLHTPTLGSLARELPVLSAERIAELSATIEEEHATHVFAPVAVIERELAPSVVATAPCALPVEECTEPMPDVEPLQHGVSIVATRKSDVSELLAGFRVATDESHLGLCRAIKELAELDLTPAPFSALIR